MIDLHIRWPARPVLKYALCVLVFAIFALTAGKSAQLVKINLWSIQYMKMVLGSSAASSSAALPPWHPRSVTWNALRLLRSGDYSQAESILEPHLADGNWLVAGILASSYEEQGNFVKAISIWKQLANYTRLYKLAAAAQKEGRPEDARLALEAGWELGPDQGARPLAQFLVEIDDDSQAENILRYALSRYSVSIYRYQWQYQLAAILQRQGKWDEAVAIYQELLRENPNDGLAHAGLARVYHARGDDLDIVIAEFQKALELSDNPASIYYSISQVYQSRKYYDEADQWLVKALQLYPDRSAWHMKRAANALEAQNFQLALQVYQEVISRFEADEAVSAAAYFEIAYIYWIDNRLEEAVAASNAALQLQPVPTLNLIPYYLRAANIYEDAQLFDQALRIYTQILQVDPRSTKALAGVERLSQMSTP